MKQIAQYQDGRLELQNVPKPNAPPGGVLVQTTHSVISVGTEKMKVEQARMNLLQKARARPDQVRKVLDTARNLGWRNAFEKVRNRLQSPAAMGYSAAGIVVDVHPGNTRFHVGDRVACGGADIAVHAEFIAVPDLLVASVPAGVPGWQAAYTTVSAIALQAVRQTAPRIGDYVMVVGQGLMGLLTTAMLANSGARVLAVDIEASRRPYCEAMGAEGFVHAGRESTADAVRAWTGGFGADAVVICTSGANNSPIEQGATALRDRGRMVILGNTRAQLDWKVFYEKEIEIRYARSYGPGRYDPTYEWAGTDYPIGYVRWTEQRNFEACLDLMARGRLNLEAITTRRAPFAEAVSIYDALANKVSGEIGVVLEYPDPGEGIAREPTEPAGAEESIRDSNHVVSAGRVSEPVRCLDVIGAGNFARTMLLPHLKGRIAFGAIVNQTPLSANHVRDKFGFSQAETDYRKLMGSGRMAAVLIATRHHLHAEQVIAALQADRHVFVEKPLCLTASELDAIRSAKAASGGSVQVGFNRRFAPASRELLEFSRRVPGPKSATFRVMAGPLDPHHWYADYDQSGGRVVGEACHFLDYFCFLFSAKPVRVWAQTVWPAVGRLPFPDSVTAQVEFSDGSCGQLIYSAEGDSACPKERLSVYGAGFVAEITNFQRLEIFRNRRRSVRQFHSKGHAEQMEAWLSFLRKDRDHPLPFSESQISMQLTFAVLESIQQSRPVAVA